MKGIIEIENLCIKYDNLVLFNNLNLTIEKNTFLTILGANSTGKSTLASIISLNKKCDNIKINNQKITQISKKMYQQEILYLNSTPIDTLKGKSIKEYLNDYFKNSNLTLKQQEEIKKQFQNVLRFKEIENKNFNQMSIGEKSRIQFLQYFLNQPIIVVLDDVFLNMTDKYKKNILEFLKKECQNKKTTVILFTSNTEETIFSKELGFLIEGKIQKYATKEAYSQENLFKKVEMKRPFMVELSTKLGYYGLLEKIYLDEKKMVQKLWKSS